MKVMVVIESWNQTFINKFIFLFIMKNKFFSLVPLNVVIKLSYKSVSGFAVKSGQRKAQVTETKETNFSMHIRCHVLLYCLFFNARGICCFLAKSCCIKLVVRYILNTLLVYRQDTFIWIEVHS